MSSTLPSAYRLCSSRKTPEVLFPLVIGGQPCGSVLPGFHAAEPDGEFPQSAAGLQAGSHAGELRDVQTHVEQAALHARVGPCDTQRFEESPATVADHHIGRGDTRHEIHPPGRGLPPGHIPADHLPTGNSDEHHGITMQMNTIEMHHVMHLVHQGHRRPQIPAPSGAMPERARVHSGFLLRACGEQPVEKQYEIITITLVFQCSGRTALA